MGWIRRLFRWLVRTVLLIGGPLAAAAVAFYIYMSTGRYVSTENAYVKAELIAVTVPGLGPRDRGAGRRQPARRQGRRAVPDRRAPFRRRPRPPRGRAGHRPSAGPNRCGRAIIPSSPSLPRPRADLEFLGDELARSEKLRAQRHDLAVPAAGGAPRVLEGRDGAAGDRGGDRRGAGVAGRRSRSASRRIIPDVRRATAALEEAELLVDGDRGARPRRRNRSQRQAAGRRVRRDRDADPEPRVSRGLLGRGEHEGNRPDPSVRGPDRDHDRRRLSGRRMDGPRLRRCRPQPGPSTRCCRRRTHRATGSRSCSACRFAGDRDARRCARRCAPA